MCLCRQFHVYRSRTSSSGCLYLFSFRPQTLEQEHTQLTVLVVDRQSKASQDSTTPSAGRDNRATPWRSRTPNAFDARREAKVIVTVVAESAGEGLAASGVEG